MRSKLYNAQIPIIHTKEEFLSIPFEELSYGNCETWGCKRINMDKKPNEYGIYIHTETGEHIFPLPTCFNIILNIERSQIRQKCLEFVREGDIDDI